MNNCNCDCNEILHGVIYAGHYEVEDWDILVEQIQDGYTITFKKGDREEKMTIRDGKAPDLTEFNDAFNALKAAHGEWQDAEAARADAEKARNIAEFGEDGEGEGTGNRQGLYKLMLELYNRLYPKIDEDLEAIQKGKEEAQQAAAEARSVLENAKEISGFDKIEDMIFYKNDDRISFVDDDDDTTKIVITGNETSCALNATGYVTDSKKGIRIKIPLKKYLDNIAYVKWEKFEANICNNGGYGLTSRISTDPNKRDYLKYIQQTIIDKVQNCIHVVLRKESGFILENNASVNCRCKDISFTLYDSESSVPAEEGVSE